MEKKPEVQVMPKVTTKVDTPSVQTASVKASDKVAVNDFVNEGNPSISTPRK
jgi:hypothetical protein